MDLIKDILSSINESEFSDTSYGDIKSDMNDILQRIQFKNVKKTLGVLKDYRFCSELETIVIGRYIRYIPLTGEHRMKLKNGGFIINIKKSKDDILIICKNVFNKIFTVFFNKCVVFQKFTNDEKIILDAIKYLGI